ncbi:Hypothetical_protein [Hexamita inflata]|uniref:Hypothetical_protein n=1 Tax=Hexamita inflata TaxID=28002 RepID=A0ABP1GDJ1_9EUKA
MKNIKHLNSQMYNRLNQQLFDIMEISESDQNMQVCNNQCNHQLFNSTLQEEIQQVEQNISQNSSQNIFWDQSSVRDVKLLKISNNQYGKRNIEQILIQTVSCDNIITANSFLTLFK